MAASRTDPETILAMFDEGVAAVVRWAAAGSADWSVAACGAWSRADLARHVLGVIGWYHTWLDAAEAGNSAPPFAVSDLAAENDRTLATLQNVEPADAIARFADEAQRYREQLPDRWDLPFGYPRGTVSAGLHAGVAACEWHFHAWDFAQSAGSDHTPSDPATLLLAAAQCLAAADGGLTGRARLALAPLGSRIRPWRTLLRRAGRQP